MLWISFAAAGPCTGFEPCESVEFFPTEHGVLLSTKDPANPMLRYTWMPNKGRPRLIGELVPTGQHGSGLCGWELGVVDGG